MDAEQARRHYITRLEGVIRQMLQPLKGVPFNLVIEAMTGHRVLEFDIGKSEHRQLLDALVSGAVAAGEAINRVGIASRRVNEVGNKIEPFVRDALNALPGARADIPATTSGRRKSAGYPDIEFTFGGTTCYLECKTFNPETAETTQRSFYFSPSAEFKVTRDALHFLLSYEMHRLGERYKTTRFKLLALESLSLDVKHEFNSDNQRLYSGQDGTRLLAERAFGQP
ncbi:MAG: hypothetical protein QMD73_02345 [Rhodocyclaceae bacterium]|nr:hypothetical protein [Rhodocyclaceae bacterium]